MFDRAFYNQTIQNAADSVSPFRASSKNKMTTNNMQSYVKEIETQRNKPIKEQLNDLTIAGAMLLRALDNYIKETNNERT